MRKCLIPCLIALAGLLAATDRLSANGPPHHAYYASAAFPAVYPPGYYTNAYYFPWYFPWYANYNYSHGPYNNWWQWGGYATYGGNVGILGYPPTNAVPGVGATVSVVLPEEATLLFNGAKADGTGTVRTFGTIALTPGREYAYELTAEVVRNGKSAITTKRVIVRAGEETKVTLVP